MEVAMEDDVFFADLNRQISLLIMDDDEDLAVHRPSVSVPAFPQTIQNSIPPAFVHPEYLSREIKGTGVFIPRSSQPRRKNWQGGRQPSSYTSKSSGRRIVSPRGVSQAANSTISYSSNHNRC